MGIKSKPPCFVNKKLFEQSQKLFEQSHNYLNSHIINYVLSMVACATTGRAEQS